MHHTQEEYNLFSPIFSTTIFPDFHFLPFLYAGKKETHPFFEFSCFFATKKHTRKLDLCLPTWLLYM